jgi:hypothetical protein
MVQITVSDEFARQLAGTSLPIVLVDSQGRQLGQVTQLKAAAAHADAATTAADPDWVEAKRQMEIFKREGGTFYTTQEVLAHLESLGK